MGKSKNKNFKPVDPNNAESLKEAGNRAFADQDYREACRKYTEAIMLAAKNGKPNHVYFANRA